MSVDMPVLVLPGLGNSGPRALADALGAAPSQLAARKFARLGQSRLRGLGSCVGSCRKGLSFSSGAGGS